MVVPKIKIKRGDNVRVILGKDRGKQGKVVAVLPKQGRVIVEGLNMVKKHVRARRQGQQGQRVSIAAPLTISNVQLVCPKCKKGTRISINRTDNERQRLCKKCGQAV